MLFKELAAHAKRAPIAIMIVPEGEHLRVTIQQKGVKDGQIPLAISVAQTPEALDAELPAALAASAATSTPAPVLDQVREQQAQAAALSTTKPAKTKATRTKAAKKKHAAKPAKKPAAAKAKKAADTKPTKNKPAGKPTKHIASKPTKDQCIAAYHAYVAAHAGEVIKREAFINGNPTGRRFERLFGNWEKFVEAAKKKGTLGPAGDTKTKPLPLQEPAGNAPAAAQVPADGDTAGTASAGADSPTVESATDVKSNAASLNPASAAAQPAGRTVITTEGRLLAGGMVIVADTGMEIDIQGHGKHRITDFDDKQIVVEPITEGAEA